jgi:protein-ribulosamine 3-kinase
MEIPEIITKVLHQLLKTEIRDVMPSSGGCINLGGELRTGKGSYFIKWNSAKKFPRMFETEAEGLTLLKETKCIRIPNVKHHDTVDDHQFILLEFIKPSKRSNNFWELLGERLACLHRNSAETVGLNHDNYIGSLVQSNRQQKSWIDFFIEERLRAQVALARKNGLMETSLESKFEVLYRKLPDLLPVEKPALLHGDLWSGNFLADEFGEPCLIDPAVYYGCREAELSFTRLFGGFDESFYASYHHSYPLISGFEERIDIYNLYPLLVHANLFGASYVHQIKYVLQKFV